MPSVLLPITPGSLATGVCFTGPLAEQQRLNAFAAVMSAVLNGQAFYNYGDTKPAVENQGYPWLRTTDGQWYVFAGVWRRPRPEIEQNLGYRILYAGTEASVPLIYGGTAVPVTPTAGPFWEIDHTFDGRSPMGPGTIVGANPAKVLAIGEAYGEGAHTQTILEMPPHTHPPDPLLADAFLGHAIAPATRNVGGGGDTVEMAATGSRGGGEAMPVVHPCAGIWILKPTARLYFVIP